jgi:hypothetical protein
MMTEIRDLLLWRFACWKLRCHAPPSVTKKRLTEKFSTVGETLKQVVREKENDGDFYRKFWQEVEEMKLATKSVKELWNLY